MPAGIIGGVTGMGRIGPRGAKHNSMNRQPARSRRAGRRPDLTHACQPRTSSHRRKDLNSSGRCILTFSLMGLVALMNHKVRSFREGAAGAWVRRAFAQGEAYVSAEPERERGHGVADSVPDAAHVPAKPRLGYLAVLNPKLTSQMFSLLLCDYCAAI